MRYNDKWGFVDDDPELDEEARSAHQEASDLREQANALYHAVEGLPDGDALFKKLRDAISMYRRAETRILRIASGRPLAPEDRELVLQCRLNAACLALKLGEEASAACLCDEALELDTQSPHAALFQARAAIRSGQPRLGEQWLRRAQHWAQKRGEDTLLKQAAEFIAPASAPEPRSADWVRQGVACMKRRQPGEAQVLLERAVDSMDNEDTGGPIEKLWTRSSRALAFNALEALSEALAAQGQMDKAASCAQRAAALLQPGPNGIMAFGEPEVHRREGLLCISVGHIDVARRADPLPAWRQAVCALRKHKGEPATLGHALLEIGTWTAGHVAANPDAVDADLQREAALALQHAADRFRVARNHVGESGAPGKLSEVRRVELLKLELKAQVTLVTLACNIGEFDDARSIVESSRHLLDSVPKCVPAAAAGDWADLCAQWALAASKSKCFLDAEDAMMCQLRLTQAAGSVDGQLEVLKALAVVQQRLGKANAVEATLASLKNLAPEPEQAAALRRLSTMLRQVAPVEERYGTGTKTPPAVVGVGRLPTNVPSLEASSGSKQGNCDSDSTSPRLGAAGEGDVSGSMNTRIPAEVASALEVQVDSPGPASLKQGWLFYGGACAVGVIAVLLGVTSAHLIK